MRLPLSFLLAALALAACDATAVETPPPPPSTDLPTAPADTPGVDADLLEGSLRALFSVSGFHGAVVVRDGAIVGEAYSAGYDQSLPHPVRSVSKSVVGLLVGIAVFEGALSGPDQPIGEILGDGTDIGAVLTPEQQAITVGDLLTMQSGHTWNESADFLPWEGSLNPLGYLVHRPLAEPPGEAFLYNSAAVHLLGAVLSRATSQPVSVYAEERLFRPLGIGSASWSRLRDGRDHAAAGLVLRPRDLAKLGVLVLNGGRWDGQQVVPAEWMAAAVGTRVDRDAAGYGLTGVDYGYLWWVDGGARPLAWGWGGQFVYVDPERDLVVATAASWSVSGSTADRQEGQILDVILNGIRPAVQP